MPKRTTAKAPAKRGRPETVTPEIAEVIAERLALGTPLAKICADAKMPGYTAVRRAEDKHPEIASKFARAREDGTHFMADDSLRIADDQRLDPAHKRVMIDTRLKLIGMWNRKAYGPSATTSINATGNVSVTITEADEKAM